MKKRNIAGVIFAGLFAACTYVTPTDAQNSSVGANGFSYAVKYVCGGSSEAFQEGVVRGFHATAINISNPSMQLEARFSKRFARAFPYQMAGPQATVTNESIGPGEAIEVECNEIRKRLPSPMTEEFRTGFVTITANRPLDVVAVYTSRSHDGEVSSIDVEIVPGRSAEIPTSQQADLVIQDIDLNTLRVSCPSGPGSCTASVETTVANIGPANAGPFQVRSLFDPNQSQSVDQAFPGGLPAGGTSTFVATVGPDGNCFDPNCTICATADVLNTVSESNETNNQLCRTRQG